MSQASWIQILGAARTRPEMYQGPRPTAHLRAGLEPLARVLLEEHLFADPGRVRFTVSPQQFHCRFESGPLEQRLESLVRWEEQDQLFVAASRVGVPTALFFLADRGVLGIRVSAGLWCQAYESGWPTTPPYLAEGAGSGIGLTIALALEPTYCAGLPFTPESVAAVMPAAHMPLVVGRELTLDWHPGDDIVPICRCNPDCVLRRENIGRWL